MPYQLLHIARLACLRQILICVLAFALPVQGMSAMLVQVMGAMHRHTSQQQLDTPPDCATVSAWGLRSGLRLLATRIAGEGTLALLDASHAREAAHQFDTAAHASGGAHFTDADVRMVAMQRDADPQDIAASTVEPPQASAAAAEAHQHAHDTFQRHIHNTADGSVVVLGQQSAGSDSPSMSSAIDAGSGTFTLPAILTAMLITPMVSTVTWRRFVPHLWHNHVNAPLERPPQH